MSGITRVGMVGFGEVGQILADDLGTRTEVDLQSFDLLFADATSIPSQAAAARRNVIASHSAAAAAAGCDLIISAVTASEAVKAARSVAGSISSGSYFLDLNSVSPSTRRAAAEVIEAGGGRFVEGALMSPIGRLRVEAPILLGGPHAAAFSAVAGSLGFSNARAFSDSLGQASAVKMCRSVLIKGMESLLAESLTAAGRYGVADDVLASLDDLLPLDDWPSKARYMISRSLQHGERRAEEMREVAETIAEAGLNPFMSAATAKRQEWAAQFAAARDEDLTNMLDALARTGNTDPPREGLDG